MRPSVITCVSSASRSTKQDCCNHSTGKYKDAHNPGARPLTSPCRCLLIRTNISYAPSSDCISTAVSQHSYDHVEEHFQRSLGINYHRATSISVSVDDHFAKALGDKWLQLKASSSSCHSSSSSSSSSPPSSPSFIHSPGYSPKRARKDSSSPTTTTPNFWSDK